MHFFFPTIFINSLFSTSLQFIVQILLIFNLYFSVSFSVLLADFTQANLFKIFLERSLSKTTFHWIPSLTFYVNHNLLIFTSKIFPLLSIYSPSIVFPVETFSPIHTSHLLVMNNNKSPGPYGIHPRALKELKDEIAKLLTATCNLSFKMLSVTQE